MKFNRKPIAAVFVFALIVAGPAHPVHSEIMIDDTKKFQAKNPNGQKYEFLKVYIKSIAYLQKISKSREKLGDLLNDKLESGGRVKKWNEQLNQENFNLRIARNNFDKGRFAQNGLMLKVIDLFEEMCNEHINYNNETRVLLDRYKDVKILVVNHGLPKSMNPLSLEIREAIRAVEYKRKESSKKLLQISDLINKILISNEPDRFGEFVSLGITQEERQVLLKDLNNLYQARKKKGLQAGQTFVEGSIVTLREALEDETWQPLDI